MRYGDRLGTGSVFTAQQHGVDEDLARMYANVHVLKCDLEEKIFELSSVCMSSRNKSEEARQAEALPGPVEESPTLPTYVSVFSVSRWRRRVGRFYPGPKAGIK